MESLQPCPCCLSDVDVVKISQPPRVDQKYYFLVHCSNCGKSTSKAYPSKTILAAIWNAIVLESHYAN